MTTEEIMVRLEQAGDTGIKKLLLKHGIKEPFFGVKVEHLKTIQKTVKKDYQLALDLYATGNADAMYLAGLIADDAKMTTADLQTWVKQAVSQNISEYTVPWVAAEGKHGFEQAMEWVNAPEEHIAASGWCTLSNLTALKPDNELDLNAFKELMERVSRDIHTEQNRVKQTMNSFIISVGSYVTPLTDEAIATANKIGAVTVDMNGTACKTPDAVEYIMKVKARGSLGKKKKTVKC